MKFVEKIARTVDDAVTEALIELGMTTDDVTIEVLEKGTKGFLGIGAKDAKVRVTVKVKEERIEVNKVSTDKINDPIKESVEKTNSAAEAMVDKENPTMEELALSGEIFLKDVLQKMGIEATIDCLIKNNKIKLTISGDKMGLIIGKRGEHLDALQYLVNLVVNKGSDQYTRVTLDTENYRQRREDTLQKLAFRLAKKSFQTKQKVILEPMNPYDRRIIHSALQNSRTVKTYSEGKEPYRKVVITPTGYKENNNKE